MSSNSQCRLTASSSSNQNQGKLNACQSAFKIDAPVIGGKLSSSNSGRGAYRWASLSRRFGLWRKRLGSAPSSRSGGHPQRRVRPIAISPSPLTEPANTARANTRAVAEAVCLRVPGGYYDAYVESRVCRLEALRRAGIIERIDADWWLIPDAFEAAPRLMMPVQAAGQVWVSSRHTISTAR